MLIVAVMCYFAAGCSSQPPTPIEQGYPTPDVQATPSAPLSAVAVKCVEDSGLIALYVQMDATHLFRFDPKQTSILAASPAGEMKETDGAPIELQKAMEIAQTAVIQTAISVPCGNPGAAT